MEEEKGVYVAVDEKPGDVIEQAASLGWELSPYIEKKQLQILDASPYFTARMGTNREKEVDVAKTVADLSSYVKRMGASRVVIDPVGPLIGYGGASPDAQEHARTLVHALQDQLETTNLLTSHRAAGTGEESKFGAEEFLFAGVVVLRAARANNRFFRTLLVQKMRRTAAELVEHEFIIAKEKGIVLHPALQPLM
jgi:circadian clock protein KaiC